jgi:hypothetical protein
MGVGVAGLAVGGVFTALTLSDLKSVDSDRTSASGAGSLVNDQSAANRHAAMSYASFGVGALGVGVGLLLFYLSGHPPAAPNTITVVGY